MALNNPRKYPGFQSPLFYVSTGVFNTVCLKLDWQINVSLINPESSVKGLLNLPCLCVRSRCESLKPACLGLDPISATWWAVVTLGKLVYSSVPGFPMYVRGSIIRVPPPAEKSARNRPANLWAPGPWCVLPVLASIITVVSYTTEHRKPLAWRLKSAYSLFTCSKILGCPCQRQPWESVHKCNVQITLKPNFCRKIPLFSTSKALHQNC